MSESTTWTAATIAEPVRAAFEAADPVAIESLLSPDVTWGPPEQRRTRVTCKNRQQVMAWWTSGPNATSKADVTELTVAGDQLLVGLHVRPDAASDFEGPFERWQILTVDDRGVADIRGYEDRPSAAADLGTTRR
ncbi:MAG TPA: nuclear transport factor 2 family protein [Acidimicrobiales bacterium]|jgi:hypothetical protein